MGIFCCCGARKDEDFDFRGDILNDDVTCAQYMTINTPNSGVDYNRCVDLKNPAPCIPPGPTDPRYASARSNHPGGVHLGFVDGHVEFFVDDGGADLCAWQALSTRSGSDEFKSLVVGRGGASCQ